MPEKKEEFYSFEDVLKELNLSETELKRMVSEGELRAFREHDKLKFRKEDVDTIKRSKITEPTVKLPTEELGPLPEEIFPEETFVEETTSLTEVMPLAERERVSPLEEELPKVDMKKEETFIEEEAIPEARETIVAKPPSLTPPPPPPAYQPQPARIQPIAIPIPKPRVHPIFIIFLGFTFLVMLFIGSIISDIFRISTGKANYPVGITRELGKIVISIFGLKDKEGNDIDLDKYRP